MVRPAASGHIISADLDCNYRNESFTFSAGALTPKIFVWVYDHKTIGKDKLLGQAEIDVSSSNYILETTLLRIINFQIWRHLQQGQTGAAEVSTELTEGHGLLQMKLEFDADTAPIGRTSSIASADNKSTPNLGSPSRFSLRGRRPTGLDD